MSDPFDANKLYEYVLRQLVAESYLDDLNNDYTERDEVVQRLRLGNNASDSNGSSRVQDPNAPILTGATRMSDVQVTEFFRKFRIVDHHQNDASGFSATLMERLDANGLPTGEYTLSFRSTEFQPLVEGGDRERDVLGADLEIAIEGFAVAQLKRMEDYYAEIRGRFLSEPGAVLNVSGYSLGGHLATVFSELHYAEINETYLFNAAGRGSLDAPWSLAQLIDHYSAIVSDPHAAYARGLVAGTPPISPDDPDPGYVPSPYELALAAPEVNWDDRSVNVYESARHKWAMRVLDPYMTAAGWNDVFPGTQRPISDPDGKLHAAVGIATHDDGTMVAGAGAALQPENWVIIEDQPDVYGNADGWIPWGYPRGNFLRTHSITLIADSLALTRLYQQADAALSKLDIETIFASASNQRALGSTVDPLRTQAEGASLEDALYALERVLLVDRANVVGVQVDLSGDGFGHLLNRDEFHQRVEALEVLLEQRAAAGEPALEIRPLISMRWMPLYKLYDGSTINAQTVEPDPVDVEADLLGKALQQDEEGLAYRFALQELSPIVVLGADYASLQEELELHSGNSSEGLTEEYLRARAQFLAAKLERSVKNSGYALAEPGVNTLFEDRWLGQSVAAVDAARANAVIASQRTQGLTNDARDKVFSDMTREGVRAGDTAFTAFGGELADEFIGGNKADALFGAGGDDVLDANGGNDRLEGGAGRDWLSGGAGVDLLFGGAGDDQLASGPDDGDILDGGPGEDLYVINTGDGADTIHDAGKNLIRWNGQVLAGIFEKGADGVYRFLSPDPNLRNLTLTFNSPATISDGAGTSLTLADYDSPEDFWSEGFGFALVDAPQPAVITHLIVGSADDDYLMGSPRNEEILAGDGADTLFGYGGDDYLSGGTGADYLQGDGDGSLGQDTLLGGAGSDIVLGDGGADRLYADEAVALANAIGDAAGATLDERGDWLNGGEGDDVAVGGAAHDVLLGGGGADLLVGGAGNDRLFGDVDDLVPEERDWIFDIQANVRYDTNHEYTFYSFLGVNANPATSAGDLLYGGAGDDLILAGRGDDHLFGGDGGDLLMGGAGEDVLLGGDGADVLWGGASRVDYTDLSDDYLDGGNGDDVLYGSGGRNFLFGGAGADTIYTGPSEDFVDAGPGNDLISSLGGDTVFAGDGDDGFATFGTEAVVAHGGAGRDSLGGEQAADRLYGGDDDDVLRGFEGADHLDGGTGDDRYRFAVGDGIDELFDVDGTDVVELLSFESSGAGSESISRATIRFLFDNTEFHLAYGDQDDRIRLGADPRGLIERIELRHIVGATQTVETIDFADLWAAYVGTTEPPNSPPAFSGALADAVVSEDQPFVIVVSRDAFVDPDGDALEFAASLVGGGPLPTWLAFDAGLGVFTGTPSNDDVGTVEIVLTAVDPDGAIANGAFLISVANVNDAPLAIGAIAAQSAEEESRFELVLPSGLFVDADPGDVLSQSASLANGDPLPAWLTFDSNAGRFSGTPTRTEVGDWAIRVVADDAAGSQASVTFGLTVTKAPGQVIAGTSGSDIVTGGIGDDVLSAGPGADALVGGKGDDTFVLAPNDGTWSAWYAAYNAGSPGSPGTGRIVAISGRTRLFDTMDGGEGTDNVQGTAGADAVFLDDLLSPFPGTAGPRLIGVERFAMGSGNDVVDLTSFDFGYGSVHLEGEDGDDLLWASAGADALFGGAGNDDLYGGVGDDALFGGPGDDLVHAAIGVDIAQGGDGQDTVAHSGGVALLDGGSGNDTVIGGAGSEMIAGGAGDDVLKLGAGANVVLHNRGDGIDLLFPAVGAANSLSLGGGIQYEDLALSRASNDLLLHTGVTDRVTLVDWYAAVSNQTLAMIQVIAAAMPRFDTNATDSIRDDAVERFDFAELVQAFDAARAADSNLARWQMIDAFVQADLGGSDDLALGGALAFHYGITGGFGGVDAGAVHAILRANGFSTDLQPIAVQLDGSTGATKLT